MTIPLVVLALIMVSMAVSPLGQKVLWRLKPHHQAAIGISAALGLVVLPVSALVVALSTSLHTGGGSLLSRCGRLIAAVALEPWARPELTLSLLLMALIVVRLAWGAAMSWRSQAAALRLARAGEGLHVVVPASQSFVFTVGLLRPRIVMSDGFLGSTPSSWQRVVLAHEEAHARGRHPLILFVVEAISAALPLAPMRWAADATRSALEAVADDYATRKIGDRTMVVEAVAGIALAPVYGAVGFEGDEVRRVRRLLDSARPRFAWAGLAVVGVVAAAILFAGGHAVHCGQESLHALGISQCRTGTMADPF